MAEDDALFQKGMPIRREVLGPEYVDASMARADEFMMSFQRATTAWAWGWAWGDATLDRKTRSLMNLALERDRWFPDSPLEEDPNPRSRLRRLVFLLYQKGP